jgi:hypothetical protein
MMTRPRPAVRVLVVALVLLVTAPGMARPQAPGAKVPGFGCRVVKVSAGPRGAEAGGDFRLEEERNAFSRTHDNQVIVYFKWESASGTHRLAATWRSPAGASSSTSAFDYTAADRLFGAYWAIPISSATPTGKWTIDAVVDGAPCGTFSFDIVDVEARPVAVARRPLSSAQMFERLDRIYVPLERRTRASVRPDTMSAFVLAPGLLATAFGAIDATDGVQAILKNQQSDITTVTAWDRRSDWALLAVPSADGPLPAAEAIPETGDRCFSFEGAAGTRVLAEGALIGKAQIPGGGMRLIVSFTTGTVAPGAPVLNEFGEVIGLVGAGLTPGQVTTQDVLRARSDLRGVPVVPLSLVRVPSSPSPASLAELRERSLTVAPATGSDDITEAGFAREIQRNTNQPIDQRVVFSPADQRFSLFVVWDPKRRLRGSMLLRLYDDDNRVVAESKPSKADFKSGSRSFTQWQVQVPTRPGIYHADVLIGGATLWRGFLTIK